MNSVGLSSFDDLSDDATCQEERRKREANRGKGRSCIYLDSLYAVREFATVKENRVVAVP